MITQYFNGEIVRHPDFKTVRLRTIQRRETNKICSFGVPEDLCKTFHNWQIKLPRQRLNCGRCLLSDCHTEQIINGISWKKYLCPRANKRYLNAIKPKHYNIDYKVYRKLSSAAHFIIKDSKYKTLFLTLTFGKFKNHEITESEANKCFSKFVENLKTNYSCEHYIGVRERGKNNNRLHYHIIISLPYHSFGSINNAWNHSIREFCYFSKNAVQSDGTNRVIKSPDRAIRYVCKYISKQIGVDSSSRLYFISNNTLSQLFVNTDTGEITRKSNIRQTISDITINIQDYLKDYKGIYIKQYDYVTVFKITDSKNFNKFAVNVIYPLFNCLQTSFGLTVNPDKSV